MTTNEALARRWMASKHWGGWRVGMKSNCGRLFIELRDEGEAFWVWCADDGCESLPLEIMAPDLDHPGTRAFLLEDMERAWGACRISLMKRSVPDSWPDDKRASASGFVLTIYRPGLGSIRDPSQQLWFGSSHDEAQLIIAALESAPE